MRSTSLPILLTAFVTVGIVLLSDLTLPLHANRQTLATQAFDVVSIKPVPPGRMPLVAASFWSFRPSGLFRCPAITAQHLITMAFRIDGVPVQRSRIVGGPDWMTTSQFEVMATVMVNVDRATFTQQLLTDLGLNLTDRMVVNQTGLNGPFDVELKWAPERNVLGSAADHGPSLFTAVQEQLGLKLVPRNVPTEVLVVDRIETPTPN